MEVIELLDRSTFDDKIVDAGSVSGCEGEGESNEGFVKRGDCGMIWVEADARFHKVAADGAT